MNNKELDIVNLIEKNPITKLTGNYQTVFINKIKQIFNENEQRIFVSSFYCSLNYNSKTDFVIDFDSIWKWLEFSRKEECKRVLTKHFTIDIDYKIITKETNEGKAAPQVVVAGISTRNLGGAGQNKEKIVMTINTFKKLCLKSNTKKADEIHDYFIKLEEIYHEVIDEESNELRNQMIQKDILFIQNTQQILFNSYHKKSIVYLIKINENLYKFGNTDIKRRFNEHLLEQKSSRVTFGELTILMRLKSKIIM